MLRNLGLIKPVTASQPDKAILILINFLDFICRQIIKSRQFLKIQM